MSSKLETYIENYLIKEIVSKLENEELIGFKLENSASLDSFMSCMYIIHMKTKTNKGYKERLLIAKFMRGNQAFKESSKSFTQYANEIYTYSTVLPQYNKLLKELNINEINMEDLVAPCHIAKFGYIEGLSSSLDIKEACLVLENLKPMGYLMGPRLFLERQHLLAMCEPIAKFHALSFALKALQPQQFDILKRGIIPFPFLNENDPLDAKCNFYLVLHRHAFDRLYEFYDRFKDTEILDKNSLQDKKLMENLEKLKTKHFNNPTRLQENLRTKILDREEDEKFACIIHGDYNRNNVLFKYQNKNETQVDDVKLIDFQQLRYGSPVLDLSFFMYFNSSEAERCEIWPQLLETYHSNMFSTLQTILRASRKSPQKIEEILFHYSYEKFLAHFSRFAFYGVIICLHFLPWMLCSDEECARISELFATDLHGEEFRKLSLEAGGDEVNMRLLAVLRHASEMGYMDDL